MARLRRVATGGVVLLTTSVFVVFSVALFNPGPVPAIVEAAGSPPLDNRFAWTREDARSFLSAFGDGGRGLYGVVLALDAVYAVTLASAGALLLAWISARMPFSTSPLQWVALLPILTGVLDLFENAGIAVLLSFRRCRRCSRRRLALLRQQSWYSSTSPPFWWCSAPPA
ncbi:MAG TPA: hypothetical protein VFH32_02630 [Rubrobacteraceae bacterium]|nr:hypothetical protein [Rubrobacteraceae bacterium]